MYCWQRGVILGISVLCLSAVAYGQEISREQIKGLDEQVQEIKSDVLGIAAELNQLEEKLLYPSNTQVAVFVSLAGGETFRLDSVAIQLDGTPVAHHLYTFKELEALKNRGGAAHLYRQCPVRQARPPGLRHRQNRQRRRFPKIGTLHGQ